METLYEYCRMARKLLQGEHGVGRVIARPFVGESGNYTRTAKRHDFSLEPPGVTMLEQLSAAGRDVISIGKIQDIFVGKGITEYTYTKGNEEGIEKTLAYLEKDFEGLNILFFHFPDDLRQLFIKISKRPGITVYIIAMPIQHIIIYQIYKA